MSMYPHRSMGGGPPGVQSAARLNELLDQIRSEFETQLRQSENYEHQSKQFLWLFSTHRVSKFAWLHVASRTDT